MSEITALIAEARTWPEGSGKTLAMMLDALADALEASVQAPAVTSKRALTVAVQSVLWNASNYPEAAQSRILGADIGPLTAKVVDAALAVLQGVAVSREALAEAVRVARDTSCQGIAEHLFASGVLQDAAEVEARGLEKAKSMAERAAEDAEERRNSEHPSNAEYWAGFARGARTVAHRAEGRAQQVREGTA